MKTSRCLHTRQYDRNMPYLFSSKFNWQQLCQSRKAALCVCIYAEHFWCRSVKWTFFPCVSDLLQPECFTVGCSSPYSENDQSAARGVWGTSFWAHLQRQICGNQKTSHATKYKLFSWKKCFLSDEDVAILSDVEKDFKTLWQFQCESILNFCYLITITFWNLIRRQLRIDCRSIDTSLQCNITISDLRSINSSLFQTSLTWLPVPLWTLTSRSAKTPCLCWVSDQ